MRAWYSMNGIKTTPSSAKATLRQTFAHIQETAFRDRMSNGHRDQQVQEQPGDRVLFLVRQQQRNTRDDSRQ